MILATSPGEVSAVDNDINNNTLRVRICLYNMGPCTHPSLQSRGLHAPMDIRWPWDRVHVQVVYQNGPVPPERPSISWVPGYERRKAKHIGGILTVPRIENQLVYRIKS